MPRNKSQRTRQLKEPESDAVRFPWYDCVGLAIVFLLTIWAYSPVLRGGLLWDDNAHITREKLRSFHGLFRIWFEMDATQQYYPLLHSAFWLEHRLWGDSMLGYHLINLLWHLVNATLVYLLLRKLKIPGPLLAAAIFAVHPVMVESVAWVTEQKNTLSTMFYLSAMLVYLNFHEIRRPGYYFLAIALFVLGLLTKTVTATLPAALLVIFWWQRGTLSWRRDFWPLVPFFALGAAAGILTAWVEYSIIGAQGEEFAISRVARFVLSGRVIWFYLGKLLWPANLMFIYPRWTIDPSQPWQWMFSVLAIAVTIGLWLLRNRSRAPLAGWLLFCGTLFPVLGFLNVYPFVFSFVADHFQYLASLAMIVLFASATTLAIAQLPQPSRRYALVAPVALLGLLACLSHKQSSLYADSIVLYTATLDRNPDCWLVHNNLGLELEGKGLRDEAMEHYRTALKLKPDYSDAHYNVGVQLLAAGEVESAIDHFRQAIKTVPSYVEAHHQLGNALVSQGKFQEAINEYMFVLDRWHNNPVALNNLSLALARVDRMAEAIGYLKESLRLQPDQLEALNNLGLLLTHSGDAKNAIPYLERAAQLRPDSPDVHSNLADALRQTGHPNDAIEHCQNALRLKPDYAGAFANLAKALADVNRSKEAVAAAEQGIKSAKSNGQQELIEQIQDWLKKYRTQLQTQAPTTKAE